MKLHDNFIPPIMPGYRRIIFPKYGYPRDGRDGQPGPPGAAGAPGELTKVLELV